MNKITHLVSALIMMLTFTIAQAADVSVTEKVEISASPALVWASSKDFADIAGWHPAIISQTTTNGSHPGSVRVVDLGGPTITEELVRFNDEHRNFTYKINQVDPAVLPVQNYMSWYAVRDNGNGGSTVIWMGSFSTVGDAKAADVEKGVRGVYRAGLDSLKAQFETRVKSSTK